MTELSINAQELFNFQEKLLRQKTYATYTLLIFIVAMYVLEEYFGSSQNISNLIKMGANSRELVKDSSEYYRLFSSIYLHAGFMHIFFNSYVLYALGGMFEKILGSRNFLIIFFISGFFGSVASIFLGKAPASVGASGAIWGFLGSSLALAIFPSDFFPSIFRKRLLKMSLINLFINLGVSLLPMVDIWAHLGGGIAGFLVTAIVIRYDYVLQKFFLKYVINVLLLGLIILNLFSVGYAIYENKPWQNTFSASLVDFTDKKFPLIMKLPNNLIKDKTLYEVKNNKITFGKFIEDELVLEISFHNVSQAQSSNLLADQMHHLLNEKDIPAAVRKTIYLRSENYGEVLSFEREVNREIFALVNFYLLDNYLINLNIVTTQENMSAAKELTNKILSSMKVKSE